jgi:hypothetical protein
MLPHPGPRYKGRRGRPKPDQASGEEDRRKGDGVKARIVFITQSQT